VASANGFYALDGIYTEDKNAINRVNHYIPTCLSLPKIAGSRKIRVYPPRGRAFVLVEPSLNILFGQGENRVVEE
jgi:hypothetical protein